MGLTYLRFAGFLSMSIETKFEHLKYIVKKIPQSGDMSDPFLYLLKFLYGGGGEKSAQKQM